tara:strand:- start:3056 stop:3799 length:744 start_codon:yes stop_codon:yes gene_type:complete
MADVKVIHISSFKPQNIVPSAPKRNASGGLRIDLDYKDPSMGNKHYLIQTPKLRVPFGINAYDNKDDRPSSYSVSLSFDNYKELTNHECEFVKAVKQIDHHVKTLALENCESWFRKKMKKEVLEELYTSSIKESNEYPPTLRVKLPYFSGKFSCDFYDQNKEKVDEQNVVPKCHVIGLLNLTSIWFVGSKFGVSFQMKQMQIFAPAKFDGFMISEHKESTSNDGSDRSRSRSPRFNNEEARDDEEED